MTPNHMTATHTHTHTALPQLTVSLWYSTADRLSAALHELQITKNNIDQLHLNPKHTFVEGKCISVHECICIFPRNACCRDRAWLVGWCWDEKNIPKPGLMIQMALNHDKCTRGDAFRAVTMDGTTTGGSIKSQFHNGLTLQKSLTLYYYGSIN